MTKYVFVTGGVVSSLGKGITVAPLAVILETCGIKVTLLKLDPYISGDPSTLNLFQYDNVFVTEDDAETALDLGRDIESLPFLEAIRQMAVQLPGTNTCFIHLTLLPYIGSAGELKTKPTQHSVKELREIGIQPDVLLCRADRKLPPEERRKIALFTNVREEAVILAVDVDSIYKIPALLHDQMLDEIVCHKLNILTKAADLSIWKKLVHDLEHPERSVKIAPVGKYVDLKESYKSPFEALIHAGIHTHNGINIHYVDSEIIENAVIALTTKWRNREGEVQVRDAESDQGGTMRLGGQERLLGERQSIPGLSPASFTPSLRRGPSRVIRFLAPLLPQLPISPIPAHLPGQKPGS